MHGYRNCGSIDTDSELWPLILVNNPWLHAINDSPEAIKKWELLQQQYPLFCQYMDCFITSRTVFDCSDKTIVLPD